MESNKKRIAVLGSTGSIGTQTLDIIRQYPDKFEAIALTAGKNWKLLADQVREFKPKVAVIADKNAFLPLKEALKDLPVKVELGENAICNAASIPETDIVVTAMVGYSGLLPTISAINASKTIALSNKETLVVAGELITSMLKDSGASIIPVDSEHSAIFQCLVGEKRSEMRKILLTASGGPFRKLPKEAMKDITVEDALNHPNWNMGAKVTIDSASMMNKGFEMIEARWLFDCEPENIVILIHPQSIVHSMVEFIDGNIKAQLGVPDMRLPIRYALGFPERLASEKSMMTIDRLATLTFEAPDYEKFPMLGFAFEAIEKGGNMPCILNAANEKAVRAFLDREIRFTEMAELVRFTMDSTGFIERPSLEDLIETNTEALQIASSWLSKR